MKENQAPFYKNSSKEKHEFLDKLLENCNIDEITGRLYCKRCKNLVHVDWYKNLAFCTMHTISRSGITYKEASYDVYI